MHVKSLLFMAELAICPLSVHCPGTDYPIANFSSEAEDGPTFIGLSWPGGGGNTPTFWNGSPPPGGPNMGPRGGGGPGIGGGQPPIGGGPGVRPPPPLGSEWSSEGCFGTCYSNVSQQSADLCAFQQSFFCVDQPDTNTKDNQGNPPVYYNRNVSCTAYCPDGTPSVQTAPAGIVMCDSQVMADRQALSIACRAAMQQRICFTTSGDGGWACVGEEPVEDPFVVVQGQGSPFGFAVTGGVLPPGTSLVQLSPKSAGLSGTYSTAGNYTFTVTATASNGHTGSASVSIQILGVTTANLPNGEIGVGYGPVQLDAEGGSAPYTWSLIGGNLPSGLSLGSSGEITGTPTLEETESIIVQVTDANGHSCSKDLTIIVEQTIDLDWNNLLWGVAAKFAGTGTCTFEFDSIQSNECYLDADNPTCAFGGGTTTAYNSATLQYTAPSTNCNVNVNLYNLVASGFVRVTVGITVVLFESLGSYVTGSHDFPFVLPDTGGIPANILVEVSGQCPANLFVFDPPIHRSIAFECIFSTV